MKREVYIFLDTWTGKYFAPNNTTNWNKAQRRCWDENITYAKFYYSEKTAKRYFNSVFEKLQQIAVKPRTEKDLKIIKAIVNIEVVK